MKEEPTTVAARVKPGDLTAFVVSILERLKVPRRDAETVADVLVLADLRGIGSHGVARLPRYVEGLRDGSIGAVDSSKVIRDRRCVALVDGGKSLGQVVGRRAMELAISKAKEYGVGLVAVRNSNHYGIAGYYTLMALREGMMGLSMTNSFPLVVPTFGRQALLGTNPISFSAPGDREPFVLDMATSVVPRGKLESYDREGQSIPLGWAVDARGRGSPNAKEILDNMANRRGGGILPLGGEGELHSGHKGYGLALMVEILCGALPGAALGPEVYSAKGEPNVGHVFAAIDVAAFRPVQEFETDLDRLTGYLKDSPKAEGQERIWIHGEKSTLVEAKRRREGIPLGPKVVASMKKLGTELAIAWVQG